MLIGHGIRLRHVEEADLDRLIPLLNDLERRGPYLPNLLTPPAQLRQKFQADGFSTPDFERLLITDEADKLLGTIWHFKSVPYYNAREIGYVLFDTGARNQGVMSQSVRLLVDFLFESTHLNRLEIRMSTDNLPSERVAIKCGFSKEGVARGANYVRGRHVDMCVYAMLRSDWAALRA
ncbi:GNAT family N-acetyltransferase [Parachitinimonas caeni]|uniref:GNAT family protein n=1 Tax=Parachitinimonas caeni TaxID=3031301 RepID=A0ABT7DZ90_9NEIS|nr:GNAT family protein [Parachitinimonas caeni]MDK2124388.1 GNAT family protein [Parachitinimonas caeni]